MIGPKIIRFTRDPDRKEATDAEISEAVKGLLLDFQDVLGDVVVSSELKTLVGSSRETVVRCYRVEWLLCGKLHGYSLRQTYRVNREIAWKTLELATMMAKSFRRMLRNLMKKTQVRQKIEEYQVARVPGGL